MLCRLEFGSAGDFPATRAMLGTSRMAPDNADGPDSTGNRTQVIGNRTCAWSVP